MYILEEIHKKSFEGFKGEQKTSETLRLTN